MNKNNMTLLDKHKDILSFRELAPSTIATYTSYMTTYLLWIEETLPGRHPSDVSWEEIRSYIRFLRENRGLNPRTVNVHIAQLRDFYHHVLKRDWDKREIPFLRFDEHLPIVPTKNEVLSIIRSIQNPKHKAEISLLYSSGIRVSELCRLHCSDIRRPQKCIYISPSKNRSDRFAILSDRACTDLIAYVKEFHITDPNSWLFPGQREGMPICDQSVANVFKKQLALLGLSDKGFNLHSLRHAFGLHLYDSGADIMSIKEAMGHKSLHSTTIYLTLGIGNGRSVKSPYDTD